MNNVEKEKPLTTSKLKAKGIKLLVKKEGRVEATKHTY
jgi:hypothetical protein